MSQKDFEIASKLLESERIIGKKINKSYKWNFGLTALILGLTLGLMKFDDTISLDWLNLTVHQDFVLVILSIALLLSQQNCIVLLVDGGDLSSKIKSIYKNLNSESTIIKEDDYGDIMYPDMIGAAISDNFFNSSGIGKVYYVISLITVSLGIQTLPIVAQVYAISHLFNKYPHNGWIYVMTVVYAFVQIAVIVSIYKQFIKGSSNKTQDK